jgi:hypothetical protein
LDGQLQSLQAENKRLAGEVQDERATRQRLEALVGGPLHNKASNRVWHDPALVIVCIVLIALIALTGVCKYSEYRQLLQNISTGVGRSPAQRHGNACGRCSPCQPMACGNGHCLQLRENLEGDDLAVEATEAFQEKYEKLQVGGEV